MKDVNEQLFRKLSYLLPEDYQQFEPPLKHWLKTTESEKNWLKNVKFKKDETLIFNDTQQLALALIDNETYLICVGLSPSISEDFEYTQINSGLFCAAIIELNIKPLTGEPLSLELANSIFTPPTEDNKTGIEHELHEISKYFPDILIFKIHVKSSFLTQPLNLPRIGLFIVTNCSNLQSLTWPESGIEIAKVISTTEIDVFPYALILRAITERKWDNAFLEVYRCIEFLLSFPKINELKIKFNLETHCSEISEISEIIENILGWRPTEEGALQGLFKNLPKDILANFAISFNIELGKNGFDNKKAASLVYKLRNDCVHFRPIQRASTLRSSINWESLLDVMLHTAHFCYNDQITSTHQ